MRYLFVILFLLAILVCLSGCGPRALTSPADEAPPAVKIVEQQENSVIQIDHAERFPLVTAEPFEERPSLHVTGSVAPDVSRTVPVVSLASGRVMSVHARLGDDVKKGQLLLTIESADISAAFSDYEKARADEALSQSQLQRARLLYDKGAIAKKDLEVAQDAEEKAQVDLHTSAERISVLGADVAHPSSFVNIYAPADGVIIEQNVTAAAGVKTLDNSPNLFTIADLSRVWIVCDVYENDLALVRLGEMADVFLNAYPDRVLHARITDIGKILDPTIRAVKVRLEIANPGILRAGMFVTATFRGPNSRQVVRVPATAVLHLHDRDWVYLPNTPGTFRRVAVQAGAIQNDGSQIVEDGISPGQQIVKNVLQLTGEAAQ